MTAICDLSDCFEPLPGPGEPGYNPATLEEYSRQVLCDEIYEDAYETLIRDFPRPICVATLPNGVLAYTPPDLRLSSGEEFWFAGQTNIICVSEWMAAPSVPTVHLAGTLLHEYLHTLQEGQVNPGGPPNLGPTSLFHTWVWIKESQFIWDYTFCVGWEGPDPDFELSKIKHNKASYETNARVAKLLGLDPPAWPPHLN